MRLFGRQKRKVRMYIQDGPTIEGTLAGRTRHTYVLWNPFIVTGDEKEPMLDISGHAEILLERVLYFQVIG